MIQLFATKGVEGENVGAGRLKAFIESYNLKKL